MHQRLLFLIIFAVFLKNIIWVSLVPLWHFPDEQAHFAQVAYIAEEGLAPVGEKPNLTREIFISEVLLGTNRDKTGNNKFTFHPHIKYLFRKILPGFMKMK